MAAAERDSAYFLSMSPFLSPMSPLSFFLDFFLLLFFMSPPESPAGASSAWAIVQVVGSRTARNRKHARIIFMLILLFEGAPDGHPHTIRLEPCSGYAVSGLKLPEGGRSEFT